MLQKENKVSLRSLSIVVRQEATNSNEERVANILRGLKLAEQAVNLDKSDPESLLVLGNSYLGRFFNVQQDPQTLELAMKAYDKAVSVTAQSGNFFFTGDRP